MDVRLCGIFLKATQRTKTSGFFISVVTSYCCSRTWWVCQVGPLQIACGSSFSFFDLLFLNNFRGVNWRKYRQWVWVKVAAYHHLRLTNWRLEQSISNTHEKYCSRVCRYVSIQKVAGATCGSNVYYVYEALLALSMLIHRLWLDCNDSMHLKTVNEGDIAYGIAICIYMLQCCPLFILLCGGPLEQSLELHSIALSCMSTTNWSHSWFTNIQIYLIYPAAMTLLFTIYCSFNH